MTPDELRALADAATPGPWEWEYDEHGDYGGLCSDELWVLTTAMRHKGGDDFVSHIDLLDIHDALLIALAPDLARLCAELGEVIQYVREGNCGHISEEYVKHARAALAKLAELEAR